MRALLILKGMAPAGRREVFRKSCRKFTRDRSTGQEPPLANGRQKYLFGFQNTIDFLAPSCRN
jgi:hypothetical protein